MAVLLDEAVDNRLDAVVSGIFGDLPVDVAVLVDLPGVGMALPRDGVGHRAELRYDAPAPVGEDDAGLERAGVYLEEALEPLYAGQYLHTRPRRIQPSLLLPYLPHRGHGVVGILIVGIRHKELGRLPPCPGPAVQVHPGAAQLDDLFGYLPLLIYLIKDPHLAADGLGYLHGIGRHAAVAGVLPDIHRLPLHVLDVAPDMQGHIELWKDQPPGGHQVPHYPLQEELVGGGLLQLDYLGVQRPAGVKRPVLGGRHLEGGAVLHPQFPGPADLGIPASAPLQRARHEEPASLRPQPGTALEKGLVAHLRSLAYDNAVRRKGRQGLRVLGALGLHPQNGLLLLPFTHRDLDPPRVDSFGYLHVAQPKDADEIGGAILELPPCPLVVLGHQPVQQLLIGEPRQVLRKLAQEMLRRQQTFPSLLAATDLHEPRCAPKRRHLGRPGIEAHGLVQGMQLLPRHLLHGLRHHPLFTCLPLPVIPPSGNSQDHQCHQHPY